VLSSTVSATTTTSTTITTTTTMTTTTATVFISSFCRDITTYVRIRLEILLMTTTVPRHLDVSTTLVDIHPTRISALHQNPILKTSWSFKPRLKPSIGRMANHERICRTRLTDPLFFRFSTDHPGFIQTRPKTSWSSKPEHQIPWIPSVRI